VSVVCCQLITRPEQSYRLWCVVVCDLETSWMRRPWPALGRTLHTLNGRISLKYNQQDATISRSIYFYKLLYMIQVVPPPIIRSTKLYIRQVLSNQYCCLLLS
jgi:hypothetical protein